ncbi:MAG: hypothetical protein K8R88_01120 [Armatimonadetes bacterium]|nr:hypothetical protein [Armatimonadota bacterium]
MKKLAILAVGTLLSVAASAQLNAFAVQNGWNNNTGTFSYSGTYPSVTMSIVNQNNTATNNYGERFIAWLSADGGVTRAKIDGHKDFSLFYTLKLNTDAAATREVEAGLLFQYGVRNPGPNEYYPTSQYYAKFSPFNGNSTIQTSGDWVLPGYNFVNDGATIARNDVVTMGIEYDYNDATPSASLQRLTDQSRVFHWHSRWSAIEYGQRQCRTLRLGCGSQWSHGEFQALHGHDSRRISNGNPEFEWELHVQHNGRQRYVHFAR